jgi:multidrug efflux system membrane fusion protein
MKSEQAAGELEDAPQRTVQPPRHERRWLWPVVIVLLALGPFLGLRHVNSAKPVITPPALPVSASVAKKGVFDVYLSEIGAVTPFATVTIKSRIAGQIMKINFTEGDLVAAGQPLFTIDPRPYQAQLDQYRGQLTRDQGTLLNAQKTLARDQALYRQQVIAKQDLDNQQALYQQSLGAVASDRGLLEAAQINLGYCSVTSPISGRVGLRQVDLGNYVQTTDNLLVITQLQPISVVFSVPQDYISPIVRSLAADERIPVEAWNRDLSGKIADGFLLSFDTQVDQNTGTVKLRAQFDNADGALFPDQFVNARLLYKNPD